MREEPRRQIHRVRRKRHPVIKVILLFVVTLLFAGSAFAFKTWTDTKNVFNTIYEPLDKKDTPTAIVDKKPISILLMGVDNGAEDRFGDVGHSDTMVVVTVNPKTQQTTMVSVPRDTLAALQGKLPADTLKLQKINAAYSVGGPKMSVATVKKLLNIPIDYFVTINMGALKKLVDAVGGVDVTVPFDFSYDNESFTKGKQHLNGAAALAYARMRHDDPEGDYGRQKRQQQIITALIKEAVSIKTVTNFEAIQKTIASDIRTNLTFDDIINVQQSYRGAAKKIVQDHLQGLDAWIGDGAYQIAAPKELNRVSDLLRMQLNLQTEPVDNEETYQYQMNSNFTEQTNQNIFKIYPTDD